jgi:RNA polymerase sigma factor (sigma-70 family)
MRDHTFLRNMSGSSRKPEPTDGGTASGGLVERAQAGDTRALSALFKRQGDQLRRWARGRLPQWARSLYDTADLVQETLLHTFRRIDRFENRGRGALQSYLRQAVMNRIRDEVRKVKRRPLDSLDADAFELPAHDPRPDQLTLDAEEERKYKAALALLTEDERMLVVGRIELDYNYDQLALVANRATSGAARMAARRAILKLAEKMSGV